MSNLENASKIISELMEAVSANSCALYVTDPLWDDQYRLLLMPGVQITEPMHGLMYPRISKGRVSSGRTYEHFEDAEGSWQLRDQLTQPLRDFAITKPQVYGDFVAREKVASCARCVCPNEMTLFVNFTTRRENSARLQDTIERSRDQLKDIVGKLREEAAAEPFPIVDLLRALEPTGLLPAFWHGNADLDSALREYLTHVLEAAMEAHHVSPTEGIGTLHLVDHNTQELKLFARKGNFDQEPHSQALDKPFGLVSWVANKRKALLIDDLNDEECVFRDLHERVRNSTRSELAVPMLVGDDTVLGVVNIECDRERAFNPIHVRTLWYSANQAAVAVQLAQQVDRHQKLSTRTDSLLDGLRRVISGEMEVKRPFDFMATLLQEWADADLTDLWSANFEEAGATYDEFQPLRPPREAGWSRKLLEIGKPIWIQSTNDHDPSSFVAYYWDGTWIDCRHGEWPPEVNPFLSQQDVKCELGLPIRVAGRSIGLAWIKYRRTYEMPTANWMPTMEGLAASLGLVMDWWERYQAARKNERDFERSVVEFRGVLFPGAEQARCNGVSAFALSRPEGGQLGGDFHQFVLLNNNPLRLGFVVGDIVGHGMPAALRMLPVLTTFRLFFNESNSTKYVVERLIKVANTLDIGATALYAVIDMQSKPPLLFASSAGHPRLTIIKQNANTILDFPGDRAVRVPLGIDETLVEMFGEDVTTLDYGDVIIAYTDGISEAGAMGTVLFGKSGILQAALACLNGTPEEIATAIYKKARAHAGGELDDDATVLVIRIDLETV